MNPDDYDEDGNNVVPCPLCLDVHCPGKDDRCSDCGGRIDGENCTAGGVHDEPKKCPKEDEFVASMNEKLKICPNGYHKNGDPKCTCGTKIANPDLLK